MVIERIIGRAAILAVLLSPAATAGQEVIYDVRFPNAVHHEAEITVTFTDVPAGPLELRMSRSSPGRYALHEFAKNVYSVRAVDGRNRDVSLTRPDPYGWDASDHDGTVRVTYTLFADRAGGTYSGIDLTHAHLNIPATFMWARGTTGRPVRVTFHPPEGTNWKVATQLAPTNDAFTFTAPDHAYFMDSPTELSDFGLREWTVSSGGRQYTIRLAVHHEGTDAELDAFADLARKVVAEQGAAFGEFPDFDLGTYTFLACYVPWAAGDGMEHRNSTSLTSTNGLQNPQVNLGTLSHEFFHAWNMERIRSAAIEPFDFERANMSSELWFGEGFTSYYTNLFIRRAGIIDDSRYIGELASTINAVVNGEGRHYFSPGEMSQRAPFVDAAVSIDPTNSSNIFISYYTWGSAIGLGLDLVLREEYGKTLDDLMQAMWRKHGKPERPYTTDDIRTALAELTGDPAFANEFFRRYVNGRDAVDYAPLLARMGILVRPANPGAATLGQAFLQVQNGRVVIGVATPMGSPYYEAGLDRGDQIVSVDGVAIDTPERVGEITRRHQPGQTVAITFIQRGRSRTAQIEFAEDVRMEVVSYERAGVTMTDEVRRLRSEWLGSRVGI